MRECPCCGHKDPAYWRNVRYRLYTTYCHISDLEFNEPTLAEAIHLNHNCIIGHYIYHYMSKSGIVQRIHTDDSRDGKTIREPEQEKHFKFVPINQTTLLVKNK